MLYIKVHIGKDDGKTFYANFLRSKKIETSLRSKSVQVKNLNKFGNRFKFIVLVIK